MRSIRKLRAKSLVARANRDLIEYYVHLAAVARATSERHREEGLAPPEYLGSIPGQLNDLAKNAAETIAESLWRPLMFRVFKKNRIDTLKSELEKYKKKEMKRNQKYAKETPPSERVFWEVKI